MTREKAPDEVRLEKDFAQMYDSGTPTEMPGIVWDIVRVIVIKPSIQWSNIVRTMVEV